MESYLFEWDPDKAASNLDKHGVSFEEARTVFFDPLSLTVPDPGSMGEARGLTVGHSARNRLLVIVSVERGPAIRIVSARLATKTERRQYEEGF